MANKNFKVRHGLDVDGNIAATDLTLSGNLTVNGTTTTLNTETLAVEDNIVVLNSNVTGSPSTDAGIEVERGDSTNSAVTWRESDDKWYQNRAGVETVIPVSTTELTEGTNQYFTQSRARQSVSVTDSGGDGSLSYDNSTGVITYTGPSAAEVRAHFSGGTGVTITDGVVAIGQSVGTGDSPTFGGATLGNITVGLTDNNTITTTDTNGNLTVTPNGTGKLVVTTETDTNISDGNYILGNISATRNASWTAPTSGLSTINSNNGISVASSTNYGAQFQVVYYSGDTTAGTNSAPNLTGRSAGGTNSTPSAVANNQVMLTLNGDGYATTNFAQNTATTNSGGGTTSIAPIQLQLYAREAFADNGTTVTNAGAGFRVRGFPTGVSMSTANRVNYIDHSPNAATYRSDTFTFQQGTTTTSTANLRSNTWNLQNSGGTTTYASFASGGHTIGNVDNPSIFIRTSGATAGTRPVSFQRNTQTATATPSTGDGASFRFQVAGSSGTVYNLGEFSGFYSSTGDSGLNVNVANGDQTASTMTAVTPFQTKLSETRIKATSTPTATAGGNTLSDVAIFAPGATNIKSDTITLESNSGTDYLVLDANEAKFSKAIRSTTTAAGNFAGGSTYTPAATITNGVSATVNSGTGGFTIALTNLLVSGESGHYQFYVNNTSGSAQQVTTTGGVVNINHNLASGSSMMITVYIVDTAAFCEHIA